MRYPRTVVVSEEDRKLLEAAEKPACAWICRSIAAQQVWAWLDDLPSPEPALDADAIAEKIAVVYGNMIGATLGIEGSAIRMDKRFLDTVREVLREHSVEPAKAGTCSTCRHEGSGVHAVEGLGRGWSLCSRKGALGEYKDHRPMPWPRKEGGCTFHEPKQTKREALADKIANMVVFALAQKNQCGSDKEVARGVVLAALPDEFGEED